jgi:hypothetical protein
MYNVISLLSRIRLLLKKLQQVSSALFAPFSSNNQNMSTLACSIGGHLNIVSLLRGTQSAFVRCLIHNNMMACLKRL